MKHTSRWHHFALVFAGVATLGGSALCASLAQARTPGPTHVAADREHGGERHGRRWHKLQAKLRENDAAIHAITSGDPKPYMALWADDPDVTLFGAWGPIEHGPQPVLDTFEWVGGRFGPGGGLASEYTVIGMSGSLAYTVGFERGMAAGRRQAAGPDDDPRHPGLGLPERRLAPDAPPRGLPAGGPAPRCVTRTHRSARVSPPARARARARGAAAGRAAPAPRAAHT